MRFEVARPGIGSRTELDRTTRIAGSRPARRCGRAARSRRIALHSVPSMAVCQAASSSSSKRPGGGPPELTTRRSSPPKAATAVSTAAAGPSGVDRSAGTARPPSRAAAASSFSPGRPIRPVLAPSAPSVSAIAPPSPPLPPPMSARAPVSPRSIRAWRRSAEPRWPAGRHLRRLDRMSTERSIGPGLKRMTRR